MSTNCVFPKVRGKIAEVYGSQRQFAKALGITETTLSQKMNGQIGLSIEDIRVWSDKLGIDANDIGSFFALTN